MINEAAELANSIKTLLESVVRLDERMKTAVQNQEQLQKKIERLEERMEVLNKNYSTVDIRLVNFEKQNGGKLHDIVDKLEDKISELKIKITSQSNMITHLQESNKKQESKLQYYLDFGLRIIWTILSAVILAKLGFS
jgi:archaellum component FlaC